MQKKYLTREEALQKLKHYCGYQERSQYEAVQKLYELGISKNEHDGILSALIEENYINEERFAVQYAGGKFRMKEWGRKKIYFGLKEKKISEYCIKVAIKSIDEEDYLKTLVRLAEKKHHSLKGEQYLSRKKKTTDYLIQKGYEPDLVSKAIGLLTEN